SGTARADRPHAGLRAARHRTRQQIPARSPVHEARRLLARSETDRPVVLDHRTRTLGSARPEDLTRKDRIMTTASMFNSDVDVLVIGAGPGGLYAASRLAAEGHRVLVCEEHETIGDPVHCTGIVASDSFDEFDLPRDAALNTLCRVRFVSPSGLTVSYSTPRVEATVIDRGRFDRGLAARASDAGAEIRTGPR